MRNEDRLTRALSRVSRQLWESNLNDKQFEELKQVLSSLSAQLSVQHSLLKTIIHVVEHDRSLPIPFAENRLSKFLDYLYGNGERASKERCQQLRQLDCPTLLLITVSYTPVEVMKMGRVEFDYLMQNAAGFAESKSLSPEWIFRKEIQRSLAENSDLPNIKEFKKHYHELEFKDSIHERPTKRARTDPHDIAHTVTHHEYSESRRNDTDPLTGDVYELTMEDVEDITDSGQIAGTIHLTDTYGANVASFVTIPVPNELTDRLIIGRNKVMGSI